MSTYIKMTFLILKVYQNLSVDDRNKAINIVKTNNNIIIKHRTLYKNIWT